MNVIAINDKDEAKIISWLQLAISKNEQRPVLCGLHVDEDEICAADGVRLHTASLERVSILEAFVGKIIRLFNKAVAGRVTEYEEISGNYPDYKQMFPTNKPVYTIAIDAKYLSDAISLSAKGKFESEREVRINFYDNTNFTPILIEMGTDYVGGYGKRKALLMPRYLHKDNDNDNNNE